MKLSELNEGLISRTIAHVRGQIAPEDIVNGAKFTLGDRQSSVNNILGNMDYIIVDADGSTARLAFIDRRNGELFDPDKHKMDISDLYDGNPEVKKRLIAKMNLPPLEGARKEILAGLLNSYNSKRVK
jgi:hypothetical protein